MLSVLLFVPFLILTVLAFAAIIRRLLGVRVGLGRTLLAAVLATGVTSPLLAALAPPDPRHVTTGQGVLLMLAAASVAVLIAMAALVIAEVLLPTGTLPGPVELWRGTRRRIVRTRRYAAIVRIALRHGLGRFLRGRRQTGPTSAAARRRLARSLRAALDEGGVTFVKVGQLLSTRRDLLPAEFVEELTALQDRAAPVPWERIEAVLSAELGRSAGEVFATIDREPLAAASVAQVHAATLPDGTPVVVKVQRPGIATIVDRDLDILRRLAATLEARTSWGRSLGVRGLALGFAEALREELDFTVERDNLQTMAAALATAPERGVRVPTPYAAISSEKVLVMRRLPGTPLGSAAPVLDRLGADRRETVAAALLDSLLDQVLVHGVFHADLHPGNLLVDHDGALGMLDLGSVGRLDAITRAAVGRLLGAVGRGDAVAASDALLDLADHTEEVDERDLQRALGVLLVRYAAPGSSAGVAAVSALVRTLTAYGLGIPAAVAAVFRAFATLEGTLGLLRPGFDLIAQARASAGRRLAATFAPANLSRTVEEELIALLPMLRGVPRRLDRIGDAIENGRLRLNIRLFSDDRDRQVVTGLVHQTLLTVIGAAAGVMATLLLGTTGGPRVTTGIGLFPVLGYLLLIVAVVLVLRVLVVVLRRD
ncbi:ABC transporter [Actinoplanes sp. SE50]|uniref:ABC1 kinase family protein n=1 Tax=unclassified Actinoplanes TaxID=2626549 RepID=UPI00023EC806|nr:MULTISPECIES: AarF/ABC1/UbiB kinase family protein [unclassified Actinoplanes]AEV85354.1 putative ubiquinone biosynthesis protein ubiB [Actinoplanes sp. SE50/110]ATO83749.1 ABC transporter [Actinoplanes sp. SE50]SLM01157.1 ABC transporter [Actinoplanes sp. SE50/110]